MEQQSIRTVPPEERVPVTDPPAPGARRETAFVDHEAYWVGFVTTEPGLTTGWHHRGDYDTFAYVVSGRARIEYGPGGREAVEGGPGTFAHVPKGIVHRETNTGAEENAIVIVRLGSGPPVIQVEGPEPE